MQLVVFVINKYGEYGMEYCVNMECFFLNFKLDCIVETS